MVAKEGVEPSWEFKSRSLLRRVRLPVPPLGHKIFGAPEEIRTPTFFFLKEATPANWSTGAKW